jgi:hypothetical protein
MGFHGMVHLCHQEMGEVFQHHALHQGERVI